MTAPFGVLLMAYGTPAKPEDIEPYYTDIRRGRPPSPEQLVELQDRYRLVGGTTPLLAITRAQADALQRRLGDGYRVFLGMKHWHPYINAAVSEMFDARIENAVGIVLAPHYSRGSIGEYAERVERAKGELSYGLAIRIIPSWHLNEQYLSAVEQHVRSALKRWDMSDEVVTVFTAHSLPVRVVTDGDPYATQLIETSRVLARRLELSDEHWTFSYQSAGRTPDPWLGPGIVETVRRLADEGASQILVVPIGFTADHLEIFYDIDHEARQAAQERGVQLERIQSLNDDPLLIEALANVVTTNRQ